MATISLPAVYRPNSYARTTTAGTPHARANMFLLNIEHFLSDILGSRYLHIKKLVKYSLLCWISQAICNLEIWDLVLMKTDINMFLLNIEHFLRDIRGSRYLHLKKVYCFVGHPVPYIFVIGTSGWVAVGGPLGGQLAMTKSPQSPLLFSFLCLRSH